MYYTIDPYYNTLFYNECKEALKNNGYEFKEFISIKPPYNWYFQLDQKPIMVNYDEIVPAESRYLVNTVQALRSNEEYLLLRRENDTGKNILRFIENEPLHESRKYGIFFTVSSKDELFNISKEYPGKIWFLGKYYNNKYRVCLCSNPIIKNFISKDQILLENNGEYKEPGRFEAELNFKVFRGNDMLLKFTETPYFEDGKYKQVKIKPEISSRFII